MSWLLFFAPVAGKGLTVTAKQSSRRFISAVLLSLATHALILLSWQHGHGLGTSADLFEKSDEGRNTGTLTVTLRSHVSELSSGLETDQNRIPAAISTLPVDPGPQKALYSEIPPQVSIATPATPQNQLSTPAPAGVPIAALYYYSIPELDQRPMLKQAPELKEEPAGVRLAINGKARLELLIENTGRINEVNVILSDLPEAYIKELKRAFSAIEYTPGIKFGRPARTRLHIEVVYVDGIINNIPVPTPGLNVFPAPTPHTPLELAPDRHQRKKNPPPRGTG